MSRTGAAARNVGLPNSLASRKAELARLAVAAAKDSIGGVVRLGDFLAKNPAFICETVPVFLRYLDPLTVPSLNPSTAAPSIADRTAVALAASASIALFGQGRAALLADTQAFEAIRRSWAQTWVWLDFITLHAVLDSHFGASTQDMGLRSLLHVVSLFVARPELQISSAETALIKLWAREGTDRQFRGAVHRACAQEQVGSVLAIAMMARLKTRLSALGSDPQIDTALDDTVPDPASAALSRVRHAIKGDWPWNYKLDVLSDELQFLTEFGAVDPAFHRQLLAAGSIQTVVGALLSVTAAGHAAQAALSTQVCLYGCARYLHVVLMEQNAPEHVERAYHAGLLRGVLQAGPWLDSSARSTNGQIKKMGEVTLLTYGMALCDNLVYRNVYRAALRAVRALQGTVDAGMGGHGSISETMKRLTAAVDEWEPMFRLPKGRETRPCHNYEKCGAIRRDVRDLKLCTGCRGAFYCSEECQKNGWNRHREFCRRVREGVADMGVAPAEQGRNDARFIDSITLLEIEKHLDTMNVNLKELPAGDVPLALIDLTEVPPKFECMPNLRRAQVPATFSRLPLFSISYERALQGGHALVQVLMRQGISSVVSFHIIPLKRDGSSVEVHKDLLDNVGLA